MATAPRTVRDYTGGDYKYGFVTDVEEDRAPIGLDEAAVRFISEKRRSRPGWPSGGSEATGVGCRWRSPPGRSRITRRSTIRRSAILPPAEGGAQVAG